MGATGESPHRLADFGFSPAWSPDGQQIVVTDDSHRRQPFDTGATSEVWVIDVSTGTRRKIAHGDSAAYAPVWSPNGLRIAYWRQKNGQRDIETVGLSAESAGSPVKVTDDAATDWSPAWSHDGRYLYFGSDRGGSLNLWRVPIDQGTGRTGGPPEPVTLPASWTGQFSLSGSDDRILYRTFASTDSLYRVGFDPVGARALGEPTRVFATPMDMSLPDVSPDGQWVTFATVGGHGDIFLVRSDGTALRRLTDDTYRDRRPVFSPDGSRIAFYSNRSGRTEIWTLRPDTTEVTQLTNSISPSAWFPSWRPTDGRAIAFTDGAGDNYITDFDSPQTNVRHQKLPRPGGEPILYMYSWSPDAKFLAGYFDNLKPGDAGIARYDIAAKRYERLTRAGTVPLWLPDSRRLLYLNGGAVWMNDSATKTDRPAFEFKEGPLEIFAISRDGKSLYFVRSQDDGDIWLATVR